MNRSKTMTLAAQAMLSAHAASTYYSRTDFNADPPRLGLTCIDAEDSAAAGAADLDTKKGTDAITLAKGETVRDGTEGTEQQQAETASAAAPGTETLIANKDGGELGGQAKTIGEPPTGQTQQV